MEEPLSRFVYIQVVCTLPLHQCKYYKYDHLAYVIGDYMAYWPQIRRTRQENLHQTNSDISKDLGPFNLSILGETSL